MRNMTILVVLSLLVIIPFLGQTVIGGNNCSGRTFLRSNKTLSRKKRYLAFPTGSAFVTTITLLKAIQLKEPSNWNLDLEFDMIWPIPNQETLYKRPSKHTVQRTRRHKRDLYANIELALANQGFPAKKCVLRMICEAKLYLSPPGVSFLSDLLRVILRTKKFHFDNCTKMFPSDTINVSLVVFVSVTNLSRNLHMLFQTIFDTVYSSKANITVLENVTVYNTLFQRIIRLAVIFGPFLSNWRLKMTINDGGLGIFLRYLIVSYLIRFGMGNEHFRELFHGKETEIKSVESKMLSRQKRYLIFPEGSNVQLVYCLTIGAYARHGDLVLGLTAALAWELPSKVERQLSKLLHRQSRSVIFPKIEAFIQSAGLDGKSCTMRALCEAGQRDSKKIGTGTFVQELLHAIFKLRQDGTNFEMLDHQEYDYAHQIEGNCSHLYPTCPYSIYDLDF